MNGNTTMNTTNTTATVYNHGLNCQPVLFPPMQNVSTIKFIAFIHALSSAVAAMGNLLVGCTIIRDATLHTYTNYFIFSLSVADGIVGAIGQPLMAYLLWSKGRGECVTQVVQYFAGSASCGASGLLLILVSIERYLHICRPFLYERMIDTRRVIFTIISFSVSSMALTSIGFTNIDKVAYSAILLAFYVASLTCIVPCYICIYRTTVFHVKQVDKEFSSARLLELKKRRRSTATIFIVVLIFLGCWAPYFILNFIWALGGNSSNLLYTLYYYALTLGYLNSSLNPFLYTFNNTALKTGIKRTLRRLFGGKIARVFRLVSENTVTPQMATPTNNMRASATRITVVARC
eukprot:gene15731-17316_t